MAEPDAPQEQRKLDVRDVAEQAFFSEKREDIWALIIAVGILLLSVVFPDQIHHFFTTQLYLF